MNYVLPNAKRRKEEKPYMQPRLDRAWKRDMVTQFSLAAGQGKQGTAQQCTLFPSHRMPHSDVFFFFAESCANSPNLLAVLQNLHMLSSSFILAHLIPFR